MLTRLYIEALLVDEEPADQVWGAWDAGESDDQVAWLAWWLIVGGRFTLAISTGRCNTFVNPLCWGFDPPVRGQLVINRRLGVRQMLAHSTLAPLLASSSPSTPPSIPR